MASELLVTINLKGTIGGNVRHTTKQSMTVDATPIGSKHTVILTKEILHTNREELKCYKSIKIGEVATKHWKSAEEIPFGIKPYIWQKMTVAQRLKFNVAKLDEGFGVSFSIIE